MTDVFVLRNQHGEYLNKSREWLASGDSKTLFRSPHRDEIINEKVELAVKHPDLRIQTVTVQQSDNGRLMLEGEDCLPKADPQAQPALALDPTHVAEIETDTDTDTDTQDTDIEAEKPDMSATD